MNSRAQIQSSSYWLITSGEAHRMEVLTIDLPDTASPPDGQRVLPVFSFREEAAGFLEPVWKDGFSLGGLSVAAAGGGWRVTQTTSAELFSLLRGACGSVGRILLDPLPEIDAELVVELVGVSRERFMDRLLDRGRFMVPR